MTSFGPWVNAIGDSAAVVDGRVSGTIYYDKITAVTTEATEATFEEVKDAAVCEHQWGSMEITSGKNRKAQTLMRICL